MSEKSDVQEPLLKYSQEIGWDCVKSADALKLRGGDRGLYFTEVLKKQLLKLNPKVLNEERANTVIRQLNLLRPTIEDNQEALRWMRGEYSVFVPEENRERNIRLIDFENPENNVYHVTDEWRQQGVVYPNRADVVFLINGVPVAIAETKSAGKLDGLAEGVEQIRRYHRETPEMFTATQVFEVTEMLNFFYGVSWSTNRKNLFNWKDEVSGDYEAKVKVFFNRERFLKVLRDYIIFFTVNDELTKIILRQHQTRAVEKVIDRTHDKARRRGLIWHTQGSGKTLTMITIASKLLRESVGEEKPTVLMIVDRNELESQLFKNIKGYGISHLKVAGSKKELRSILASDYRGLVVSMIHKFDDIPADINTRDSIIVLVDEAHRTTSGDLGNYLMAALPNATYIGFTGTPVDRISKGKGTFKVFGVDDDKGYLDKYSIAESIEDGTTVRLNYAHGPSELRVDKETLEKEFWQLAETEGVSDIDELNAVLDRAVHLKELMKSPHRVESIARLVAEHFTENVEQMGFKAFLVGVDREACALYKHALDKYLPAEYSRVVYSSSRYKDKQLLKEFALTPDDEKQVRKSFIKKSEFPKILIVTEKLLTGFDAPILYCMYLDKPMRDHVLLQTIARVNRPYEDEDGLKKPCGIVLDFVGIFENLEKALAFDSDVVTAVIQNLDVLKDLIARMMKEQAPEYLPLAQGWGDKAKEQAIQHFEDKELREKFFRFFREVQSLYDIISPDAFLGPYIKDYQSLAHLYGLIREAYANRPYADKELTEKTKALLQKQTEGLNFEIPGAVHELGPEQLAAIKSGNYTDTTKILNLRKILSVIVDADSKSKPFLLSIGERVKVLEEAYENRQISTQDALAKFEELAEEYVEAEDEQKQLGVDDNTYAIYTALKPVLTDPKREQAERIDSVFLKYPDYQWDTQQESGLRAELYKVLKNIVGSKFIPVTNMLMKIQRVRRRNGN